MKKEKSTVYKFSFLAQKSLWQWILVLGIFAYSLFSRFYRFTSLNIFGWDQVDNAWAAKHIIIDHAFPLVGMVAKQNSNVNIGPLYYYYVSIFYFFTHLDPVASGIIAGVTSIISFWILFIVAKKLFSTKVALIAVFIQTVSIKGIMFDRVQWPVAFVPCVSLLIFYFLYKAITANSKYLLYLGIAVGASFHLHFTSLFYPLCILVALPFLPRKKETLLWGALGLLAILVFLIPTFMTLFEKNYVAHALSYGNSYYNGFHLRRMMQLSGDAFIQFLPYTKDSLEGFVVPQIDQFLSLARYVFLPLFSLVYLWKNRSKQRLVMVFLTWVWFFIPWIVFTTYKGELSEYYFSANKFIALLVMSYLLASLFTIRYHLGKVLVLLLLGAYAFINVQAFFTTKTDFNLDYYRQQTLDAIGRGEYVNFVGGLPQSYLFYQYKLMKWPYKL